MIPLGYMAKKIMKNPEWLNKDHLEKIYSVSGCLSDYFTDYINYWNHNGYGLFDDPRTITEIMNLEGLHQAEFQLFFYEAYEEEYDPFEKAWFRFGPEKSLETNVIVPTKKEFEGFDIITYNEYTPGCSPLSCNGLARDVVVNSSCLLDSLKSAASLVDSEIFLGCCSIGSARLVAVYTCSEWETSDQVLFATNSPHFLRE